MRIEAEKNVAFEPWIREQARREPRTLRTRHRVRTQDLRCHPDLCARLRTLAEDLPHGHFRFLCGFPILVHDNGVVFAVAAGTTWMALRIPDGGHGAVARSQWGLRGLGREWVDADPWLPETSAHDGLRRARGWARAAYDHASRLVRSPVATRERGIRRE
ncbi:MAG TPA: hypothetical protein VFW06_05735 [Acidimicrobiia bacterium]|nr:hypothetical protein [Acidimicrobiia bacterium]